MKIIRDRLIAFAAGVLLTACGLALAATRFTYFTPATGILKGSATTYVTTAATSSDVIATFSGSCNGTTVLVGDGSCSSGFGTSSSGTFTATYTTGFTVNQTQNYQWYKVGNIVTIAATSQMSGTSNAVTLVTASGAAPAAIRPTNANTIAQIGVAIQDAGTGKQGCLRVDADGTMAYGIYAVSGNICGFNTWTATGTKLVGSGANGVGQTFGTYGAP